MNSDPNAYVVNGEFASSGNDNSVEVILNVPSHTIVGNGEKEFTSESPAPSKWKGKQIIADIQYNSNNRVPGTYVYAIVPVTYPGGTGDSYAFVDVTRIENGNVQLRCRTVNASFPVTNFTFAAFSITARVRTAIGN